MIRDAISQISPPTFGATSDLSGIAYYYMRWLHFQYKLRHYRLPHAERLPSGKPNYNNNNNNTGHFYGA